MGGLLKFNIFPRSGINDLSWNSIRTLHRGESGDGLGSVEARQDLHHQAPSRLRFYSAKFGWYEPLPTSPVHNKERSFICERDILLFFELSFLNSRYFQAKVERSSLPLYSTYIFAGRSPYVGFGWHTPGESQHVLTDALYNLGSQVSQFLTFLATFILFHLFLTD